MFCDQFSIFLVLSPPSIFHFLFLPLLCTEISFSKLLNRFTNQTSQSDSVLGRLFPVENIGYTRKQGSKKYDSRILNTLISLHWQIFSSIFFPPLQRNVRIFVFSFSSFYSCKYEETLFFFSFAMKNVNGWTGRIRTWACFDGNERRNLLRPCFHSFISFIRIYVEFTRIVKKIK